MNGEPITIMPEQELFELLEGVQDEYAEFVYDLVHDGKCPSNIYAEQAANEAFELMRYHVLWAVIRSKNVSMELSWYSIQSIMAVLGGDYTDKSVPARESWDPQELSMLTFRGPEGFKLRFRNGGNAAELTTSPAYLEFLQRAWKEFCGRMIPQILEAFREYQPEVNWEESDARRILSFPL